VKGTLSSTCATRGRNGHGPFGQKIEKKEQAVQYSQRARVSAQVARVIFLFCALLLIVAIILVIFCLSSKTFSIFFEKNEANPRTFLTVDNRDPTGINDLTGNAHPTFGAFGLILGSVVMPLALGTAVFLSEMTPAWLVRFLQPLMEIFPALPSGVIAAPGLTVLLLTSGWPPAGDDRGAVMLVPLMMVLPTTVSIAIDALRAVPGEVREARLTRWQIMRKAVIPVAGSGLGTAVVPGLTCALGETLAVALVVQGNRLPQRLFSLCALFQSNVNLTMVLACDFGETSSVAQDAFLLVNLFGFLCVSRSLASRSLHR
jgi:phosphate transport system permease protein